MTAGYADADPVAKHANAIGTFLKLWPQQSNTLAATIKHLHKITHNHTQKAHTYRTTYYSRTPSA